MADDNHTNQASPPEAEQHWAPRFYLAKFVAVDRPAKANKEVWVADLDAKRVYRRSPKSIAKAHHFYEQTDTTSTVPRIEPLMKLIEDEAAPVLRALDQPIAAKPNIFPLLMFIAMQIARTPLARRTMQYQLTRERTTPSLAPIGVPLVAPGDVEDPLLHRLLTLAHHLEANPTSPDAALLNTVLRPVRDLLPKLVKASWFHFDAPTGFEYVTSDHPAMLVTPQGTELKEASAGRKLHAVFPLSPRSVFVGCLDNEQCETPALHVAPHVDRINRLVVFGAETQVYCSRRVIAETVLRVADSVRATRKSH